MLFRDATHDTSMSSFNLCVLMENNNNEKQFVKRKKHKQTNKQNTGENQDHALLS